MKNSGDVIHESIDEAKVEVKPVECKVTDMPKATVFQVCCRGVYLSETSLAKSIDRSS